MALSDRITATDYYDRDAPGFAARYDSVSFEAVHPLLSRYLPSAGTVLDVGAGSGRDARAMVARGLSVTAIEPSAGLRAIGAANSPGVTWIDDRLPRLFCVRASGMRFDFILCSAVLMLVAPADLDQSFATLGDLLAERGRLAICGRDGPMNRLISFSIMTMPRWWRRPALRGWCVSIAARPMMQSDAVAIAGEASFSRGCGPKTCEIENRGEVQFDRNGSSFEPLTLRKRRAGASMPIRGLETRSNVHLYSL